MRHRNGGYKLGCNTSYWRAFLRNLVTSIIINDRIEYLRLTFRQGLASASVEKMITLGKER